MYNVKKGKGLRVCLEKRIEAYLADDVVFFSRFEVLLVIDGILHRLDAVERL